MTRRKIRETLSPLDEKERKGEAMRYTRLGSVFRKGRKQGCGKYLDNRFEIRIAGWKPSRWKKRYTIVVTRVTWSLNIVQVYNSARVTHGAPRLDVITRKLNDNALHPRLSSLIAYTRIYIYIYKTLAIIVLTNIYTRLIVIFWKPVEQSRICIYIYSLAKRG